MQSISLGRFLGPVLLKFCLIATISLVLGFVAGPKAGWVLAATLLALYVCGFVFALYRTVRWMEASQQTLALQAPVDEWNSIASLLYRTRKLERAVRQAESVGARVLLGGHRRGALMEPTILADVPRHAELATRECFGPLAPILAVDGLDDALALANATAYGLSSGVVTRSLDAAVRAIKGIRAGTVNINEIPGYRLELSPFGGVKDSGLGIKEGVIEAMRFMSTVKTYSLPW